jgi:predicted nucleic acid-binding protein
VRVVLDASAAVELAKGLGGTSQARNALLEADEVLSPDFFIAEVTNAIWKCHEFSAWNLATCEAVLEEAVGLVDTLVSCRELYRAALVHSRAAHRPVYDMFYLALARREGAQLLTLDKALRKEARRQGVETL